MIVEHKSLLAEILYTLGRASAPLNSSELYERCDLSDKPEQISKALYELAQHGKIVRAAGEGRARYTLPDGVAAPAPAGKEGRPLAAAPAAAQVGGIRPADMPTLGDPVAPTRKKPGPKPKVAPADHLADAGKVIKPSPRCEQVSKLLDTDAERLADAIIARLKKHFTRLEDELEIIPGHPPTIHIHIEQVDVHLGGL